MDFQVSKNAVSILQTCLLLREEAQWGSARLAVEGIKICTYKVRGHWVIKDMFRVMGIDRLISTYAYETMHKLLQPLQK